MAGRQDAKTDGSSQPLAATIVAAWLFQGLFLGSIAWLARSEPMYWVFADDLSLQWQVVLIVGLPALLSGYWLVEHYARRLWGKRRLPLFVLVDILAWASIALYSAPACRCGPAARRSVSASWASCPCSCSWSTSPPRRPCSGSPG
jgi:hypothetical protein